MHGQAKNRLTLSSVDLAEAKPTRNVVGPPRLKVLLIEDNPDDAWLVDMMVTGTGSEWFTTELVERLEDGIERLKRRDIGLVLLDLSLPDSHGLPSFARLRDAAPGVPVIILSGLDDATLAVQAVHEGAQDYLVKGQVDGPLLVRAMRYAIERKRMTEQLGRYAGELRTRNAQLEADLNMAREVQQLFLPHQYPTFPHWRSARQSALQFSHRYLPASAVGGDFIDIFAVSETTGGVFLCDVMGHGIRAALVTAIMRGLVEELLPSAADPGRFLSEINRSLNAILKRTSEPFMATAYYLVPNAATGEVKFASAGHPSPFYVHHRTGKVDLLKECDPRHGPALGLFERPEFPTCWCAVEEHDRFILYTDGIYEVHNQEDEEFGLERLLNSVRRKTALSTERMLDEILEEVQGFSQTREFEDDVCLVGVEVREKLDSKIANGPNGDRTQSDPKPAAVSD